MQNTLLINNMYAAYSANSAHVDSKSVSDLSKMIKKQSADKAEESKNAEMNMDKVIISKEALSMLKAAGF